MNRGVTRRPLLGLLIPAAVAVLFIALPLIGLLGARRLEQPPVPAGVDGRAHRATPFARVLDDRGGDLADHRRPARLPARAHRHSRDAGSIRGLVTLPLVLPPVVGGIALQTRSGPDHADRDGARSLRDRAAIQHRGRRDRRGVRRLPLPRDHRRSRARGSATTTSRRLPRPSGLGRGDASGR